MCNMQLLAINKPRGDYTKTPQKEVDKCLGTLNEEKSLGSFCLFLFKLCDSACSFCDPGDARDPCFLWKV